MLFAITPPRRSTPVERLPAIAQATVDRLSPLDLRMPVGDVPGLLVPRESMLCISGNTSLKRARELVRTMQLTAEEEGDYHCQKDSVIAVVENGEIIGVLEVGQLHG